MKMSYRPWGSVDWVLSLIDIKEWSFIGCIGSEDRSLCCYEFLKGKKIKSNELFAEILPVEGKKYYDSTLTILSERELQYKNLGGRSENIERLDLFSAFYEVKEFCQKAEGLGHSIILDLSSFPKRFFFPLLRILYNSKSVHNLVVTYTSPDKYASADFPLYEDVDEWKILPGFDLIEQSGQDWIVSVGFLVESLRRYIGDHPDQSMKILIPFPAPPPTLRRTWQVVANLEQEMPGSHLSPSNHPRPVKRFETYRVDPHDISHAFEQIRSLASRSSKSIAFAPFGPKPISTAMCLYASTQEAAVYYPQPTVYNPKYSEGILENNPIKAIKAYWLKFQGNELYECKQ